ncbi:MAG: fimbrillin family protein [Bacteroidales bacterium]
MKKILCTIGIIGIAVMLASCSKEHDLNNDSLKRVPIVFGSTIEATTRAIANTATQFAANDKIGIIGYRTDNAEKITDFSDPFLNKVEFTYGSNNVFSSAPNANAYWQLGKFHNFYAYYPSNLNIIAGGNNITPTTTLTVARGTGIVDDVMHANIESYKFTGATATAQLNFTHKLSKVRFKVSLNQQNNPTVLNKIEFTMKHSTGTYNVVNGDVTNLTGNSVSLNKARMEQQVNATPTDVNAEWIVLPGDTLSNIKLTINGPQELFVTIPNGIITTTVGKVTTIAITITIHVPQASKRSKIGIAPQAQVECTSSFCNW